MKNIILCLIFYVAVLGLSACGEGDSDGVSSRQISFSSVSDAQSASPTGDYCTYGEIKEVFVPDNRGRGNDNGSLQTIDDRTYEPAYRRMDVTLDGIIDERDAQAATKGIFVKQIDKHECPATADVGTFPQGLGPDGFFTAEDIVLWRGFKKGNNYPLQGLICARDCKIINHMRK